MNARAAIVVAVAAATSPAHAGVTTGSWDDAVEIEMPPAPGRAAPRLSIQHDHRVAEGTLGSGYRLGGTSVISRRSATGGVPELGATDEPSQYRLDGQLLVARVGSDPTPLLSVAGDLANVTFEPLVHDGSILTYDIGTNTWTRRDDGWTWTYGGPADGAVLSAERAILDQNGDVTGELPVLCSNFGLLCQTAEWYLVEVVDPDGNRATLTYTVERLPVELEDQFALFDTEQSLLTKVTYAGATVTLTYEARPDPRMDMSSGVPAVLAHRLTAISSITPAGGEYSEYALDYEDLDDGSGIRQTLLTEITRLPISGPGSRTLRTIARHHATPAQEVGDGIAWPEHGEPTPIAAQLDGDGLSDLIVLAFGEDENGLEKVDHRVYLGSTGGTDLFVDRDTASAEQQVFIETLEAELEDYFDYGVFGYGRGYVIGDLDRDGALDALVENRDHEVDLLELQPETGVFLVTPHDDLEGCDLRFSQLQDVNGDGLPDLVRIAHLETKTPYPIALGIDFIVCPARTDTQWAPNTGLRPYVSWTDHRDLEMPLELPAERLPEDWQEILDDASCEPLPRADAFDEYSEIGTTVDHARFADFNQDGLVDVAYALHGCHTWDEEHDDNGTVCGVWRPAVDSLFSRIFFGDGAGSFVDSGLHAGPPMREHDAEWDDGCMQMVTEHRLVAFDTDRDGHTELLRGTCEYSTAYTPRCDAPPLYDAAYDRGLVTGYGASAAGFEDIAFTYHADGAVGDFDGNGFLDTVAYDFIVTGGHDHTPAEVYVDTVGVADGRVASVIDEHGGTHTLTWGFTAEEEHANPELEVNLEVLTELSGADGTTTFRYSDGVASASGFRGFGLVEETNAAGAVTEHASYTDPGRAGLASYRVDRRLDTSMETVSVFVQGYRYDSGAFMSPLVPPYDSELLRRCDYDLGRASDTSGTQSVTLDELIADCHAFAGESGVLSLPFETPDLPLDKLPLEWWTFAPNDDSGYCPGDPTFGSRPGMEAECEPVGPDAPLERLTPEELGAILSDRSLLGPRPLRGTPAPLRWPEPHGMPLPPALDLDPPLGPVNTVIDEYITDYFFEHAEHRLDLVLQHRDTAITDDDLETRLVWGQPDLDGPWYRLMASNTFDVHGDQRTAQVRFNFTTEHFDRPEATLTCGRGFACRAELFEWNADGSLAARTLPDGNVEEWTYHACGAPETYTDPAGRVRSHAYDAHCRATAETWLGATHTHAFDGYHRVTSTTIDSGVDTQLAADQSVRVSYDDATDIVADTLLVEPRQIELHGDRLTREYRDEYGRTTQRTLCRATNPAVLSLANADCEPGSERVVGWWGYDDLGHVGATAGGYRLDGDVPATTAYTRDERGRIIATQAPGHLDHAGWQVTLTDRGPGRTTTVDPIGRSFVERRSTLSRTLQIGGRTEQTVLYDPIGLVTHVVGPDSETIEHAYDDHNTLEARWHTSSADCWSDTGGAEVFGACDDVITFERDALGRVLAEHLPDGTTRRYTRDAIGRPLTLDFEDGSTITRLTSWTYDDVGRTVTVTDEGGNVLVQTFDALQRPLTQQLQAPGAAVETLAAWTYDDGGLVASATGGDGLVATYTHEPDGSVASIDHPATGLTTFARDGAGRVLSITDATGVVRSHDYRYSGLPGEEMLGDWLVGTWTYDAAGRTLSELRDGVTWTYVYDDFDRPLHIERGGLTWEDRTYDDAHRLETSTIGPVNGSTAQTSWSYDAWGRPIARTDALLGVSSIEYDAAGRVRVAVDEAGYRAATGYDRRGRIVSEDVPGGAPLQIRYTTADTLDGIGGLTRVEQEDGEGSITTTWTDARGRTLRVERPDGTSHSYVHDGKRLVTEIWRDTADAALREKHYGYDPVSHHLEVIAGPALPGVIGADPVGACADVFCIQLTHDAVGRILTHATPTETTTFGYGATDGLLATETVADRTTTYRRDDDHPWVSGTELNSNGATRTTTLTRDAAGRVTRREVTNGVTTDTHEFLALDAYDHAAYTVSQQGSDPAITHGWAYDALGRAVQRKSKLGTTLLGNVEWWYHPNGVVAGFATPGGDRINYLYGVDNALDTIIDGNQNVIAQITERNGRGQPMTIDLITSKRYMGYDDLGRTVSRDEEINGALTSSWVAVYDDLGRMDTETFTAPDATWVNDYDYDPVGRLVREVHGKSGVTYDYVVDLAGNRLETRANGVVTSTMTYDGNTLTSVNGVALGYNAFGDVLADQRGYTYALDASGRVRSVTSSAGTRVEIGRDVDGMPIVTRDPGAGPQLRVTHWDHDPEAWPLAVRTATGRNQTYVQAFGQVMQRIDRGATSVDRDRELHDATGTLDRFNNKSQGSVTAFGDGLILPASNERFLFHRMETLTSAPAIQMSRLRAYDPQTGRFLSPDPIGLAGGPHRTLYTSGDPVNYSDPLGLVQVAIDGAVHDLPDATAAFVAYASLDAYDYMKVGGYSGPFELVRDAGVSVQAPPSKDTSTDTTSGSPETDPATEEEAAGPVYEYDADPIYVTAEPLPAPGPYAGPRAPGDAPMEGPDEWAGVDGAGKGWKVPFETQRDAMMDAIVDDLGEAKGALLESVANLPRATWESSTLAPLLRGDVGGAAANFVNAAAFMPRTAWSTGTSLGQTAWDLGEAHLTFGIDVHALMTTDDPAEARRRADRILDHTKASASAAMTVADVAGIGAVDNAVSAAVRASSKADDAARLAVQAPDIVGDVVAVVDDVRDAAEVVEDVRTPIASGKTLLDNAPDHVPEYAPLRVSPRPARPTHVVKLRATDVIKGNEGVAAYHRKLIEFAQETGELQVGKRPPGDASMRRAARSNMIEIGSDITDQAACHEIDSVIALGHDSGAFFFADASINSSIGSQLGNQLRALGAQVGDYVHVEFADDFPETSKAVSPEYMGESLDWEDNTVMAF